MQDRDLADLIRYYTLKELGNIGYGHYGGSLSIVECLAVLYNSKLKVNINNRHDVNRDYFILSKGHAGPAYYATLALKGFFEKDILYTLNANGTNLPSHPDRNKIPGVDMTTGSLGQGLSVAAGVGYYLKVNNMKNRVYCILGDGELNEGQIWEALLFINHHKLDNITIFVDENKKQLDGLTKDICDLGDLDKKFMSFGYYTKRVKGNDTDQISSAIDECIGLKNPHIIILDNIKGSGVEYIENLNENHHLRLNDQDKKEIDSFIKNLEKNLHERGLL